MVLKEINFSEIRHHGYIGLAIMRNGKCIAEGDFGDVLISIPELANENVKGQRPYFNEWVAELN